MTHAADDHVPGDDTLLLIVKSPVAVSDRNQTQLVAEGRQLASAAVLAAIDLELREDEVEASLDRLRAVQSRLALELGVHDVRLGTITVTVLMQEPAVIWAIQREAEGALAAIGAALVKGVLDRLRAGEVDAELIDQVDFRREHLWEVTFPSGRSFKFLNRKRETIRRRPHNVSDDARPRRKPRRRK